MSADADQLPRSSSWRPRAGIAIALATLAIVPLLPVLFAGRFPRNHDGIRYEVIARLVDDAIRHGVWYPRWLPTLAGGAGYPTLVYYQPLVFYAAAACGAIPGVTAATAVYAATYGVLLLGAGGAYRVARLLLARSPAIAAVAIFLLTPYLYVNLLVRGDFSEAAAMLLAPWPIWAVVAIERRLRAGRAALAPSVVGAIALAAIFYAHPAVSLFYAPTLAALATSSAGSREPAIRLRLLRLFLAIAGFAVVASSPYWFVVWQHADLAHLERAIDARYSAADYTVPIDRLIGRAWGFGASPAAPGRTPLRPPDAFDGDPMATPLGLPHALLAIAGLVVALRTRRSIVIAAGGVAAVVTLAITPLATAFWTHAGTIVRLVQFPWRLLAVLAPLTLLLCASAFEGFRGRRWRAIGPWLIVALSAAWYAPMFRVSPRPFDLVGGPRTLSWRDASALIESTVARLLSLDEPMAGANEFEPIWITHHDRPRGDAPAVIARVPVRETSANSPYRIDVDLDAPRPDAVIVGQSYFPGWHVTVDDAPIDDADLRANLTAEGKMIVPIPAGRSHLVAFYDGPPYWRVRVAITLALLAAFGTWIVRASRDAALPIESASDDAS